LTRKNNSAIPETTTILELVGREVVCSVNRVRGIENKTLTRVRLTGAGSVYGKSLYQKNPCGGEKSTAHTMFQVKVLTNVNREKRGKGEKKNLLLSALDRRMVKGLIQKPVVALERVKAGAYCAAPRKNVHLGKRGGLIPKQKKKKSDVRTPALKDVLQ